MAIANTTPREIHELLAPAIEAITPRAFPYRDNAWRRLKEGPIDGADVRTFSLIQGTRPIESFDGLHGGDGIEYEYEMRIRVSYHGVSEDDADDIIWSDGRDLWLLVHPLPSGGAGSIPGLLSFRGPLESEPVTDEEGFRTVDFILETHFKASDL